MSCKNAVFLSALTLVLILNCSRETKPVSEQKIPVENPRTFYMVCEQDLEFTAHIKDEGVWLFMPGGTLSLPRAVSASGEKFSDGNAIFWMKGDSVFLDYEDGTFRECSNQPSKAIWEHSKLTGVSYRGAGNEPGWSVEIVRNGSLTFVTDYGETIYVFTTPEALIDRKSASTTYRSAKNSHKIQVRIVGVDCFDDMSGERFPTSVEINLDGKIYHGCGRSLH